MSRAFFGRRMKLLKKEGNMCWSCNPICGGCRPPRKRPVKCPECATFNAIDLEHFSEPNPCSKCGHDLTSLALPEAVICTICEEVCYNPCRKGKEEQLSENKGVCQMRVSKPLQSRP